MTASFFATPSRGKRVPEMSATATLGPRVPSAPMRRTLNVDFSLANSTQPTTAVTNEMLTTARAMGLVEEDFATIFKALAQMAGVKP